MNRLTNLLTLVALMFVIVAAIAGCGGSAPSFDVPETVQSNDPVYSIVTQLWTADGWVEATETPEGVIAAEDQLVDFFLRGPVVVGTGGNVNVFQVTDLATHGQVPCPAKAWSFPTGKYLVETTVIDEKGQRHHLWRTLKVVPGRG